MRSPIHLNVLSNQLLTHFPQSQPSLDVVSSHYCLLLDPPLADFVLYPEAVLKAASTRAIGIGNCELECSLGVAASASRTGKAIDKVFQRRFIDSGEQCVIGK
eukprot:scaffold82276_cov67-Cyclotella_meneghiniana.AAC.1